MASGRQQTSLVIHLPLICEFLLSGWAHACNNNRTLSHGDTGPVCASLDASCPLGERTQEESTEVPIHCSPRSFDNSATFLRVCFNDGSNTSISRLLARGLVIPLAAQTFGRAFLVSYPTPSASTRDYFSSACLRSTSLRYVGVNASVMVSFHEHEEALPRMSRNEAERR